MIEPGAPWFNRPKIWDKEKGVERSLFWNELSREQKELEIQYNNTQNKKLLRS